MKLLIISFLFIVNNPIVSHASNFHTYEEKNALEMFIKKNIFQEILLTQDISLAGKKEQIFLAIIITLTKEIK